jgi:hypothetical protein
MNMVIRARGVGPSMPMHDQSLPGTGTSPPTDHRVNRRDNGINGSAEEPQLRERKYHQGDRHYVLTLPPGGSYEAEDDAKAGLMHIHRHDSGGQGSTHVCSVPAGAYEMDRDEAGVHIYRVPDRDNVRMPLREHGERDASPEPEERDLAMGPGHSVLPRPAGAGRGRDDGPTEYQRLRAYQQRLNEHYSKYRNWIKERTS